MPALPFAKKLDQKLIGLVRQNPVLYDVNDPKYTDSDAREVAWQKIGEEIKRPASMCKSRWVNIRDMMRRRIRDRMSRASGTRAHGRVVSHYKYESEMEFIVPHMKQSLQEIRGKLEDKEQFCVDVSYDGDQDAYSNHSDEDDQKQIIYQAPEFVSDAPRTATESRTVELVPSDPIDVFLLTIGSSLRKFSPYYLNQAKSKIFQVVQDYELQQIVSEGGTTGAQNMLPN